jgi:hypothetical protein
MRIKYNKKLRDVLNNWDLLGVLPHDGGPKDEYDMLNTMIMEKLQTGISITELENYLRLKITDYFGLDLNELVENDIKKFASLIMQIKD